MHFSLAFSRIYPLFFTSLMFLGSLIIGSPHAYGQCDSSFVINPSGVICHNQTVAFIANQAGALSYTWTYGDGGGGTGQISTHQYNPASTQNFNVSLTVLWVDSTTCTSTQTITVNVPVPITVSVPLSGLTKCVDTASSVTTFQPRIRINTPTTGLFTWNMGDGTVYNDTSLRDYSHPYTQFGIYTVTITQNGGICPSIYTTQVRFLPEPIASLRFKDKVSFCEGDTLTVLNQSVDTNFIDYYVWIWGDGDSTTTTSHGSVSHLYSLAGLNPCQIATGGVSFNVTLKAYNSCPAPSSPHFITSPVRVKTFPVPRLIPDEDTVCVDSPFVTFDAGSSCAIDTINWDFGDGTVLLNGFLVETHAYTQGVGTYLATVTGTNECGTRTASVPITVIDTPKIDVTYTLSDSLGCTNLAVDFTNNTTPTTGVGYTWSVDPPTGWGFGTRPNPPPFPPTLTTMNSKEPILIFHRAGTYVVTLVAENQCQPATWMDTIVVKDRPTVNLLPIDTVCGGLALSLDTVVLYNLGNDSVAFNWQFIGGIPSSSTDSIPPVITFGSGNNTIIVQMDNDCGTVRDSVSFYAIPPTAANAGNDTSMCLSQGSIQLTGGPPGGYWTGDSITSSGVFTPTMPGVYQAIYNFGIAFCYVTDTINITVFSAPPVDAGPPLSICQDNTPIQLTGFPSGGFWKGPKIDSLGFFTPDSVFTGFLIYCYGDSSTGCFGVDTTTITVRQSPVVTVLDSVSYCLDDGPIVLTGYGPTVNGQGTWSGNGVTDPINGIFLSDSAGLGVHFLLYTFVATNGCRDSATMQVRVIEKDSISAGPDFDMCINDGIITLSNFFPTIDYLWSSTSNGLIQPDRFDPLLAGVGTHQLILTTDSADCQVFDTLYITVFPNPTANAGMDTLVCFQDSFQLTGVVAGGDSNYVYQWSPALGLTDSSILNPRGGNLSATQTYTLLVVDGRGCTAIDSMRVTVNPQLTADAGADTLICYQNTFQLHGNAIGGTAGYDYRWSPGVGLVDSTIANPMGSNLNTSQQYILTITDANGCMAVDTVMVMVNDSILVSASATDSLICFGDTTTLIATTSGGAGSLSYLWSPLNDTTAIVSSGALFADQQFLVAVTDSVGCFAFDTVLVTVSPLLQPNAGPDQGLCLGDSLTLGAMPTQTGGIPPYTCSWDSAGVAWSTTCNPVITGLTQPTQFVLTVTDSAGCTASDSVRIIASPPVSVDAGSDALVCYGDSLRVNAQFQGGIGPFTFQWTSTQPISPANSQNPLLTNLTASAWVIVEITDSIGCQAIDSMFVVVNPQVIAQAGLDTLVCYQDSFQLGGNAMGGNNSYTYQWSPATGLLQTNIANPRGGNLTAPQTYTLLVSDSLGCTGIDSMQVIVNPPLVALAGPDTLVCFRDSFQLAGSALGGAGGYTYSWSPALASVANPRGGNLTATQAFVLTVTDSSGCTAVDTVMVIVNDSIGVVASALDSLICYGQSTQLMASANGGSGGFGFAWSHGPVGANASTGALLADQQFVVTATDAIGCSASDDVTVRVSPVFVADAGPDQGLCLGDSLTLGAMPTQMGGIPPYTCSWDSAGVLWATACNPVITGLTQPTQFVLTVTDSAGCTASDSVTIIAAPLLVVDAGPDTLVCFGDSLQANALVQGGIGPFSYQWTSTQILSNDTIPNPVLQTLTASAWVVVQVTDSIGCIAIDSFFVTVNPQMIANAGLDTLICYQDSFQLAGSAIGGDSSYVYQWSPALGLVQTNIANPRGGNLSTSQTYTLLVTDGKGCTAVDSMQVIVNPQLIANAGPDTLVCFRDSFQLAGSAAGGAGGYTYNWSPTLASVANPSGGNLTASQTYILTVTDSNGCTAVDTVMVIVNDSIGVVASALDSLICYGQSTQLMASANGGSGGFGFAWSHGPAGASVSSGTLLANQQFIVTATDVVGCSAMDDVTVRVSAFFVANAGPDLGLCLGDSIVLGAMPTQSGGLPPYTCSWDSAGVLWSTACNPVITGLTQTTSFVLTVTDSAGCIAIDTVIITAAPLLTVDAGPDTLVCFGDSLQANALVQGGIGPFIYQWTSAQTLSNDTIPNPVLQTLTASAWVIVQVTDSIGCQAIDSFFVTVNPQLIANAGLDTLICYQDSFQLAGSAVGGDSSYMYQWSPAGGLVQTNLSNPRGGNLSSTQTYTLLVTDGKGCTAIDSMQVIVNPQLITNAGPDTLVCFRDSFQLAGSAAGGAGGYIYSWSPTLAPVANPVGGNLTASQTYILTVTDSNGCTAVDTVMVIVNDSIGVVASALDSLICYGQSTQLMASANGGSGGFGFAWSHGPAGTPVSTGALLADQSFIVTVTDTVGCSATDDVTVLVSPFFVANAGPDQGLCLGDSLVLGGMPTQAGGLPPYTCSWDSAGILWSTACNPVIKGLTQPTPFVLTVTDSAGCIASDTVNIIAAPLLTVDAGLDTLVCFGDSLQANALVQGGIGPFMYQWTSTQTLSNATLSNPVLQNLTASAWVVVQVTDSIGCIAIDSFFVTVNPDIVITLPLDSVCDGQNIVMNNSVTGGTSPYQYQWNPGTFLSATNVLNPQVINLTQTTNYTVAVTDSVNCVDSAHTTVTFVPLPQPAFTISYACAPDSACVGDSITLTDISVAPVGGTPIQLVQWDVDDDGQIDYTGSQVTFVYPNKGLYTIKQYVTSAAGCLDSTTQQIQVSEIPTAAFTLNPHQACAPFQFTLTDQSSGYIKDYHWEIFGRTPAGAAVVVYSSTQATPTNLPQLPQGRLGDTTFYVRFTVSNCCGAHSFLDSMTIQPLPLVGFATSQDTGCAPINIRFLANQFVTVQQTDSIVFHWGDGDSLIVHPINVGPIRWDTVSHTFAGLPFDTVTYQVTLTAYTPCGDSSYTAPIYVKPNQVRSFFNTAFDQGCEDHTVRVINQAAGNNLLVTWCFNFDTLTHSCIDTLVYEPSDTVYYTYTQPGDYVIAQFVNDGCSHDTSYFVVHVWPKPTANFTVSQFCLGDSALFTNQSAINDTANAPGSVIAGYRWTFTQQDSSLQINPSFLFDTAGTYSVTLVAISDKQCADTVTKPVTILPPPSANLAVANTCVGDSSQLTDLSQGFHNGISHWWVDWGDGLRDTVIAPAIFPLKHLYAAEGTYTVRWAIVDGSGCRDTTSITTTVHPLPIADFVADTACHQTATQFTDMSFTQINGAPINRWDWTYGDGFGAITPVSTTSHTYMQAGIYTAGLTVRDLNGCEHSALLLVQVDTLPQPAFVADSVCFGEITTFTDQSRATSNPLMSWAWSFGDGGMDSVQHTNHQYGTSGIYGVSLTATDNRGCEATLTDNVVVFQLPDAAYGPMDSAGCAPFEVPFVDQSVGYGATISRWNWDFGSAGVANAQNPTQTFGLVDTFTIRLEITDSNGCKDTTMGRIISWEGPMAAFIGIDSLGCAPQVVTFTNQSTGPYPLTGWAWNFGDGSPINNQLDPMHNYLLDGQYTVTLIATDIHGCRDTAEKVNYVKLSHPQASFSQDLTAGCPGTWIQFTDLSVQDTALMSWRWDFGNGDTSNVQHPSYQYHVPGIYDVTLTVTNVLGCTHTFTRPLAVEIYTPPTAGFDYTTDSLCSGVAVILQSTSSQGSSPISSFQWQLGDGNTASGATVSYTYAAPGTYPVTLIISDGNTCKDTLEQALVSRPPLEVDFEMSETAICASAPITFTGLVQSNSQVVTWAWDFGDGEPAEYGEVITHIFFQEDSFTITLIATDIHGCMDTVVKANAISTIAYTGTEEVVRATVVDNLDVLVEWRKVQHPWGAQIQVERYNPNTFGWDNPRTYDDLERTFFLDKGVFVQDESYTYRINVLDVCGDYTAYSNVGKSILLNFRDEDPKDNLVTLYWTAYRGWTGGVEKYEIQVFDDSLGMFVQRDVVPGTDTAYVEGDLPFDGDLSSCLYRIKAYEQFGNDTISYSNYVQIALGPEFHIPNAFTPNGDGHNEFFEIKLPPLIENTDNYRIRIFSRWGVKMFESNDVGTHWDGRYKGEWVPEGVYVYVIDVTGKLDQEKTFTGTVTVIR